MNPVNPFSIETTALPTERIVDRHQEVAFLSERVIKRQENVLVTGAFGIGKTCLLRKFRKATSEDYGSSVLLIEMEMFSISEDPSLFLSDVLLKLFQETWTSVLNMPFSELLVGLESRKGMEEALLPSIEHILQLYRIVRPSEVSSQYEKDSTIGVDKFIKRVVEEKGMSKLTRGGLKPVEFIHLTYELLDLLSDHGIQKTIIFGDEANHIDPNVEVEIIKRNFEVFSQRNVQFVFTAQEQLLERIPRLQDAFPATLKLEPFSSLEVLKELFSAYLQDIERVINFSDEAQTYIWKISSGHPREIQRLCQACTEIAYGSESDTVNAETVLKACLSLYNLIPR